MLLEYDIDTKDEKMVPKAIELRRRVAGRKLQEQAEIGIVDEDTLIALKTKNRDQRSTHAGEDIDISELALKERISIARSQHQFEVEGQLRHLQKDVSRAARLGKAKIDSLTDLEKRIQNMRAQLREPSEIAVEDELANTLSASNNRSVLDHQFSNCKFCNRRILNDLIVKHEKNCAANAQSSVLDNKAVVPADIYDVNQDVVTGIATFVPQPPRHCKVAMPVTTSWFTS
jgi:hypothetical protein